MDLLKILFGVFCLTTAGYCVLGLVLPREAKLFSLRNAAAAFGLGSGFISGEMFLFSLTGIPFRPAAVLLPWFVPLFMLGWKRRAAPRIAERPTENPPAPPGKTGPAEVVLAVFLWAFIVYAFLEAAAYPITVIWWDSWAIWGFKAKAFFLDGKVSPAFLTGAARDFAHPDYPLLIPLTETFVYSILGRVDEQLVKFLFPLYYLGLLGVFYSTVRSFSRRPAALAATLMLAVVPRVFAFAGNGYADLALAFYYGAGLFFLFLWREDPRRENLLLGSMFAGMAAWTKSEGQVLFLVAVFVFFIFAATARGKRRRSPGREAAVFFLFPALFILPWFIFSRFCLRVESDLLAGFGPGQIARNLDRIGLVARAFAVEMINVRHWNITWPLLAAALLLSWRRLAREPAALALTGALLLQGMFYFLAFLITPHNLAWHLATALDRLVLQMVPLALFLLALLAAGTAEPAVPKTGKKRW